MVDKNTLMHKNTKVNVIFHKEYHPKKIVLAELICNNQGRAIDCKVLNVTTCLPNSDLNRELVVNQAKHLLNAAVYTWLEIFESVVNNGNSLKFEKYNEALSRWYHVQAYATYNSNQFVAIFEDIMDISSFS
ncbi:hypothetical protein LPY66_07825 [Dehalobacter sp. DCM]|uniref:hypothetical protein n=1 Tax=Dehalobacter sp. DCM TaxID=2907827 RepID=UPI00308173AC|nr:hypothetical protein LPY66_07825 [Dehalobacter sp. DCM]